MNGNSMHIVRPAEILREHIESYYLVEFTGSNDTEEFEQKPVSNGRVQMFIGYDDTSNTIYSNTGEARVDSGIVGVHDLKNSVKGMIMEPNRKICKFVSINFKMGGFYNIFKIPSFEIYNSFVDTFSVIGNEIHDLREKLTEARYYAERRSLLDAFFIRQLNRGSHKSYNITAGFDIASYIQYHKGNVKVTQLVNDFKVTERTLQRELKAAFGLSPKEYCKIVRFNSLLNCVSQQKNINWFDMVSQFGYHDQSHMIHEFKSATGLTPDIYLKYRNKRVFKIDNHLVLVKPGNIYTEVYSALALGEANAAQLSGYALQD